MVRSFSKKIIILSLMVMSLYAGSDEEFFLRGNKLYESHDYDKALASYEMIQKKGRAVLYNMGNCYYQKNDYPQAIVYWTRAERGATPQDSVVINENKKRALRAVGVSLDESFVSRISSCAYFIMFYVSLFFLQIFFLFSWYLLLLFLYKNMRFKKIMIIGCLLMVFIIGLLLTYCSVKHFTCSGIVMNNQVALLSGPHQSFHQVGIVNAANHVVVKERREGWYKIQYSDKIGWVEAEAICII